MSDYIDRKRFRDIDLEDSFFDSLKSDYREFCSWYRKKADEEAYVLYSGSEISAFMYLKVEDGEVTDVDPPLAAAHRIKIGTLKVDPHGTKLGERFIKKAIDHCVVEQAEELYVTVFRKHDALIRLLEEFGFVETSKKETPNGEELVLVKCLGHLVGDLRKDYPIIVARGRNKFLLAIYPKWHTKLFPDSILDNEPYDILTDVSHTNSIQKTYVCFMDLSLLRNGDLVLIYRTTDDKGPAWYRSVLTSVCTVEEVRSRDTFADANEYVKYTEPFSVFNGADLLKWWRRKGNKLYVIKMLYNAAFSKRLIRRDLVEKFGLDADAYWGFMQISDSQFSDILMNGGIDESLVIH